MQFRTRIRSSVVVEARVVEGNMFESILADILNRYLKPYVKKLDTSQLRLGIWKGKAFEPRSVVLHVLLAGDVCLENLELKEDMFVCIE